MSSADPHPPTDGKPSAAQAQAPAELLNPSVAQRPAGSAEIQRAQTYFRRVTKHENPAPARWQRMAQIGAGLLSAGATAYFVLFADFGEKEHCFSSIRRAVFHNANSPFRLSPEEEQWARTQHLNQPHAAATSSAANTTAQDRTKVV